MPQVTLTPITYKDAAILIGMKVDALRNAAFRGVLTRLPRTGTVQPLIREQVELFLGKGRLSLYALSLEEKEIWSRYNQAGERAAQASAGNTAQDAIEEKQKTAQEAGGINTDVLMGAALAGAALASALPALGEVPQGNPFQVLATLLRRTQSRAG